MNVRKVIGNRFISTPGDWRTEAIPVSKALCFKQGFSHIHFYYRHPKRKARGAQRFTAKNAREYYARKSILFFACLVSFTVGKCARSLFPPVQSTARVCVPVLNRRQRRKRRLPAQISCHSRFTSGIALEHTVVGKRARGTTDILSSPARGRRFQKLAMWKLRRC